MCYAFTWAGSSRFVDTSATTNMWLVVPWRRSVIGVFQLHYDLMKSLSYAWPLVDWNVSYVTHHCIGHSLGSEVLGAPGAAESTASSTPSPRALDTVQRSLNWFFTALEKANAGHITWCLLYRRRKGNTRGCAWRKMYVVHCPLKCRYVVHDRTELWKNFCYSQ